MTGETENLVLEHLGSIRGKLDPHDQKLDEILTRLARLATGQASIRRDQAGDAETVAHLQVQLDRLGRRVGRIEQRLDLVDTP